jgi:hypothetical protein
VYSWGNNHLGAVLGDPDVEDKLQPTPVKALGDVRIGSIAATVHCSYAVAGTGQLHAWGCNGNGFTPLGYGGQMHSQLLYLVASLQGLTVAAVASNAHHKLAVAGDGSVYAWATTGQQRRVRSAWALLCKRTACALQREGDKACTHHSAFLSGSHGLRSQHMQYCPMRAKGGRCDARAFIGAKRAAGSSRVGVRRRRAEKAEPGRDTAGWPISRRGVRVWRIKQMGRTLGPAARSSRATYPVYLPVKMPLLRFSFAGKAWN